METWTGGAGQGQGGERRRDRDGFGTLEKPNPIKHAIISLQQLPLFCNDLSHSLHMCMSYRKETILLKDVMVAVQRHDWEGRPYGTPAAIL